MLDTLEHGDYAEHLNTKFRVAEVSEPLDLELINVSDLKTGGSQEYFSLTFLGNKDKILPQKLYDLEHEILGRGLIFLVPVGESENGIEYEAVFNRLKID